MCPASEDGRPAACDGGQDPALDMPAQAAPWHGYTGRSLLNINIFEYIWFIHIYIYIYVLQLAPVAAISNNGPWEKNKYIYIYIHVNRYTQRITKDQHNSLLYLFIDFRSGEGPEMI